MKGFLLLLLMLCSIQGFSQTSSDDQTILHAAISTANDKIKIAEGKKNDADAARQKRETAKTNADNEDANNKKNNTKDTTEKHNFAVADGKYQEAKKDSTTAAQEAQIAQTILSKVNGDSVHTYPAPVPYGAIAGIFLIITLIALACWLTVSLIKTIKGDKFNLREALSENVQDTIVLANPVYENLPDIIKSLNDPNGLAAQQLADKAAKDKATADEATAQKSSAQKALDDANTALTNAVDDVDKAAKQGDVNTAQKTLDDAKSAEAMLRTAADASAKAAAALVLTPAMLTNLGNLFPATIKINVSDSSADGKPVFRPSASRLIAFISAMLLFIVGLASTCFFLYFYLVNGIAPDLSKLSAILIALGIGMAPYAVNKVANAASDKDQTI